MELEPGEGRCRIGFPQYFRDATWADSMGAVQEAIKTSVLTSTAPSRCVTFDLSRCRWIDPLPLMSTLLEIATLRLRGIPVIVELPLPDDGPTAEQIGPHQISPNRLLGFLDREGFLESLSRFKSEDNGLQLLPAADPADYRKLHGVPVYEDAHCIPITLFEVPTVETHPDFAQRGVEELMFGVDSRLDAKVAPRTKERLTYKLRVALQEALHNAQEHAYDESAAARLIAVYVRYRTGGLGLGGAGRTVFEEHAREERTHCPGLDSSWLRSRPGCVEVFLIDRGIGMVNRFELAHFPFREKYKFNEVMWETFLGGRSSKPERHTLYGGLHLLHNLMRDTGDFVRALDDGTWFFSSTPVIRESKQTHRLARAKLAGLAMHLRLAWKQEADDGHGWMPFEDHSEVWRELSLTEHECAPSFDWFQRQSVVDERLGGCRADGEQAEWILWLVRPHRMKWDILSFIKNTVAPRAAPSAVLVIADIPSYEADTYAAALAELRLNMDEKWPLRFSHIVLCTNRWRFAFVSYESSGRRHGYSKLMPKLARFNIIPPPFEPRPASLRLAIVRWLKWHDSRTLWKEVGRHNSMFIAENVQWGHDDAGRLQTVAGYIDFAQTGRNRLCAAIYRASLARVLGIMPARSVQMLPLGHLTSTVLRDIHTAEVYEPASQKPPAQMVMGSVLVSGSTLKAAVTPYPDLHFFVHRSSPLAGKKPGLLFWLPEREVAPGISNLKRIGRTATIAPDGWKSFEVPRFDAQGRCIGGRDPQSTYKDWQDLDPVVVKAGHWCHEGHHDFITVNIAGAVEAAFLEKGSLARFLINRILPFIGLTADHMEDSWRRLLDLPAGAQPAAAADEPTPGLLVYRSHPSSESIIGRLLDVLTEEGSDLAHQRIFSIVPVRMRRGGSTLLIPPLVREEIRAALGMRPKPVLIFDDAVVTGRTFSDLEAALSAMGARDVSTLVVANRLRQPAEKVGVPCPAFYWRLDVPTMGRDGTCPLCNALHLAEGFKGALAADNARQEISEWMSHWEQTSPLDNWSAGLRPLPLSAPEKNKGYCYRKTLPAQQEEKYLVRIDIFRSTGLVIHASELHAMTGRDDYCLEKLREHKEPEVRVELAVSQIFMFGNEFDIDIRIALVQELVAALPELRDGSPHVHLACLGIISGLVLLDIDGRRRALAPVADKRWNPEIHYSVKVLLAYLAHLDLTYPGTEAHRIGSRLLSTVQLSLASRLRTLFLETLSPLGNPHSETIPLLQENLQSTEPIKSHLVRDASDSLDRLADLFRGLDKGVVRKDARQSFKTALAHCEEHHASVKSLIHQCGASAENRACAREALTHYLEAVRAVTASCFYRISSAPDYFRSSGFENDVLRKQIIENIDWSKASSGKTLHGGTPIEARKRVVNISSAGAMEFDMSASEVWVAWCQGIPGIVVDLIRNAVYAPYKLVDPWSNISHEKADMWLRVDYCPQYLELKLANACELSAAFVKPRLKDRWQPLLDVGGEVDVGDMNPDVLAIRLRIPYAPYLRPSRARMS